MGGATASSGGGGGGTGGSPGSSAGGAPSPPGGMDFVEFTVSGCGCTDTFPRQRRSVTRHTGRPTGFRMSELRRSDRKRTQTQFQGATEGHRRQTLENQLSSRRAHEAAVASAYEPLGGLVQLSAAGSGGGRVWVARKIPPLWTALRRLPPTASASCSLFSSTETPIRCAARALKAPTIPPSPKSLTSGCPRPPLNPLPPGPPAGPEPTGRPHAHAPQPQRPPQAPGRVQGRAHTEIPGAHQPGAAWWCGACLSCPHRSGPLPRLKPAHPSLPPVCKEACLQERSRRRRSSACPGPQPSPNRSPPAPSLRSAGHAGARPQAARRLRLAGAPAAHA
jgi:hypothetical protein